MKSYMHEMNGGKLGHFCAQKYASCTRSSSDLTVGAVSPSLFLIASVPEVHSDWAAPMTKGGNLL